MIQFNDYSIQEPPMYSLHVCLQLGFRSVAIEIGTDQSHRLNEIYQEILCQILGVLSNLI